MLLKWYDIRKMDSSVCETVIKNTNAQRKSRIRGIAQEDDRKRTVAGELLAREMLGEKLGMDPWQVPLNWEDEGKPQVEAEGVFCSVSHSGPYVVCAVAEVPVGVDVEVIRTADEKFMRRTCSDREMSYIRYGDAGCFQRFWECWTAKESLFKLTGHGPLLSLSAFALPRGVVLDHILQNGCTVTVAMDLNK